MSVPVETILSYLDRHPGGVTAAQASRDLKLNPQTIASRLSKMAMYGKIARVQRTSKSGATYLPKADPR